jgi:hypothetical protein
LVLVVVLQCIESFMPNGVTITDMSMGEKVGNDA